MNKQNETTITANEYFKRDMIFLKDKELILSVFPFNHDIKDDEFEALLSMYSLEEIDFLDKSDFCLMYEKEFGWGWILKDTILDLDIPSYNEYKNTADFLLKTQIINKSNILNIDYKG